MKKNNDNVLAFIGGAIISYIGLSLLENGFGHHAATDPLVPAAPGAPAPTSNDVGVGGFNTVTTGTIGSTGIPHGPATVIIKPSNFSTLKGLDGKPAQNGYYLAGIVWKSKDLCGATSQADAENRACVAIGRYIASKFDRPLNFFETQQFINNVKLIYGKYVTQVATRLLQNPCPFKDIPAGTITSDHLQKDGIFDPMKQIADDYIHFGCAGQSGLNEYYEGKPPVPNISTVKCQGQSAVPDNSQYRTS